MCLRVCVYLWAVCFCMIVCDCMFVFFPQLFIVWVLVLYASRPHLLSSPLPRASLIISHHITSHHIPSLHYHHITHHITSHISLHFVSHIGANSWYNAKPRCPSAPPKPEIINFPYRFRPFCIPYWSPLLVHFLRSRAVRQHH